MNSLLGSRSVICSIVLALVCGCSKSSPKSENAPVAPNPVQLAETAAVESSPIPAVQTAPVLQVAAPQLQAVEATANSSAPPAVAPAQKAAASSVDSSAVAAQPAAPPQVPSASQEVVADRPEATDDRAAGDSEPATVAQVVSVLNLMEFPKPEDAHGGFTTTSSLYCETKLDVETANIMLTDEFLKRGFEASDEFATQAATVTIKLSDRPMTIFLSNSHADNVTHVRTYHHQGIDISEVPRLEVVGSVDERVDQSYYTTPIGVIEGQFLLRDMISKKDIEIARMMTSNGVARTFEKDGMQFVCHVEDSDSMEFEMPGEGNASSTRVHVSARGNLLVDELPRPDDFEKPAQPYNAIFGVNSFYTKTKASDAAKRAAETLREAGWTSVAGIRGTIADSEKLLIRNGYLINIRASEYENGRTQVDYNLALLSFDLPAGIETRLVRVDVAGPKLFFTTSESVDRVAEFYTKHLVDLGWKLDSKRRLIADGRHAEAYDGDYFQPLLLDISRKGSDTTWVSLSPADDDELAKVFSAEKPSESSLAEVTEIGDIDQPAEIEMSEINDIAALQPALGTTNVPDMTEKMEELARQQMEAALKDLPADQAAIVRQLMESSLDSILDSADVPELADVASDVTAESSGLDDGESESMLDDQARTVPDGLIAAASFPLPEGATNVTRDYEMITFSVDHIEANAKFVRDKLQELGWKIRGEPIVDGELAMLRFQRGTGTINFSMTFDDRRDPPVHAVIHGDGIWFPESAGYAAAEIAGEEEMELEAESVPDSFDDGVDDGVAQAMADFQGLTLPEGIESPTTISSRFRSEFTTSVDSDLKTVYEFFQTAADESGWKTVAKNMEIDKTASLRLTNDEGEMLVDLIRYDGAIEIQLAFRDPNLAKEFGFVPDEGTGRMILANATDAEATIVINGKSYGLAAERGADDPRKGILLNVQPGLYNYTIKAPGREDQSDKIRVVIGGTWALMILPGDGHMAERMY